jgi:hypothetical protein
MKRYAYLVAVLALAGCVQSSPSIMPGLGASSTQPAVAPSKKTGPKYIIAIELPSVKRSNGPSKAVKSVTAVSVIGRRKYHETLEAPTAVGGCRFSKSSGFTGCEVVSQSTATLKKATFTLYSQTKAKGCAMAVATYSGGIVVNGPLSLTFKAKKC